VQDILTNFEFRNQIPLFSDNQDGWQRQSGWMTPGWSGGWA
jgi:hypothetical protein